MLKGLVLKSPLTAAEFFGRRAGRKASPDTHAAPVQFSPVAPGYPRHPGRTGSSNAHFGLTGASAGGPWGPGRDFMRVD